MAGTSLLRAIRIKVFGCIPPRIFVACSAVSSGSKLLCCPSILEGGGAAECEIRVDSDILGVPPLAEIGP